MLEEKVLREKAKYLPKEDTIKWHKLKIDEIKAPFSRKQKIKTRKYFLGIPSPIKGRQTVKQKKSKFDKDLIRYHKERIKQLKQEEKEKS